MSAREARLLALASQGLDAGGQRGVRTIRDVVDRLGLLQIDSVNVFERAHYMPVFSRIGPYPTSVLDELAQQESGKDAGASSLTEYWAHEASLIPLENYPLYRWRMQDHRANRQGWWGAWAAENEGLLSWLRAELDARGPLTISEIEHDRNKRKGGWWGWSDVKTAVEWMFLVGDAVSAGRSGFSRRYALPEQVLPDRIREADPGREQSQRTLVAQAARTLGVATAKDLADYHRMKTAETTTRIRELQDEGTLVEVAVEGWRERAWVWSGAWQGEAEALSAPSPTPARRTVLPRRTVLLSPFDPLVWCRPRTERIFGFTYRIEIYTPAEKRVFGYYTLPILHRGHLVGRIDVKSERKESLLRVNASWHEERLSDREVSALARDVARHLDVVARWQGLERWECQPKGNLAPHLALAGDRSGTRAGGRPRKTGA